MDEEGRTKMKSHKARKALWWILGFLLAGFVILAVDGLISPDGKSNPYSSILLDAEMEVSVNSVQRLDESGNLYYMECTEDYDRQIFRKVFNLTSRIQYTGCSAFLAETPDGDIAVGRNYDLPHKDKNGEITGLNVVVHIPAKDGKYETIAMADACWFTYIGMNYVGGALDDGKTNRTMLALLPYFCMDGMNEKGLTATILALYTKEGESPTEQSDEGKDSTVITVLLRDILDNCADVQEAVEFAESVNMKALLGLDYHLFVTDASGVSAVFEWRYDTLKVTYTDAVTNFYVGYDDAADMILHGQLKETFDGPAETKKTYHYGFGHGYGRFNTIVSTLDQASDGGIAVLDKEGIFDLLGNVFQVYTDELSSYTQYSVMYNSTKLSLTVSPMMRTGERYIFNIHGEAYESLQPEYDINREPVA